MGCGWQAAVQTGLLWHLYHRPQKCSRGEWRKVPERSGRMSVLSVATLPTVTRECREKHPASRIAGAGGIASSERARGRAGESPLLLKVPEATGLCSPSGVTILRHVFSDNSGTDE